VHPGQWGDDRANVEFYRRADIVFALYEADRQKLIDLGVARQNIRLSGVFPHLPGSSDPHGFRARHGLGDAPVVLFVGRLSEYKGPRALLRSAPTVWQTMPDVRFVFGGPEDSDSRRWFDEQRDERIRYLGLLDEQEKADAMAACHLFCMPSLHEVLPAVYLEAWSYGKPVIGGPAHGLKDLIEGNGAGITVDQEPHAIAKKIVELLADDDLRQRMGERGRALMSQTHSKSAVVRNLENAYAEVALRTDHERRAERREERDPANQPIGVSVSGGRSDG
jgi:phosphatidyl-myo-inositol dimannoside synthase